MSRQYPMWFDVTNCNYSSGKSSYGGKDDANTTIRVGSSSSNSHEFLRFRTSRTFVKWKGKDVCVFKHSIDGIILKIMIFEDNKGKAGNHIKTITKLKSIKSLSL